MQILEENSLKETIPEIILIMVAVLVLLQQMEGKLKSSLVLFQHSYMFTKPEQYYVLLSHYFSTF